MRLVFAGTPKVAVPSLNALLSAGHDVAAVLTRPDAPSGRSKRPMPSPVACAAEEAGIEILRPQRLSESAIVDRLREIAPDVCPVVAYGALVPQPILEIPVHGWVNVHFSLLPAWRGAAPVQRALMAGKNTLGITTFALVKELDAGPIYAQKTVKIGENEVAGEALDRLSLLGAELLVDTLTAIGEGAVPYPQEGTETYAAKLTSEETRIDWTVKATHLANLVRGSSPEPGAWTLREGRRFKVLRAHAVTEGPKLAPGELWATKRELFVGTGDGLLVMDEVQAFGKKSMSGAEWARGAKPEAGERFE